MKSLACVVFLAAALFVSPIATGETSANRETVLERWLQAFNAHDADAMAKLAATDVSWFNVSEDGQQAEVQGREALRDSMRSYFSAVPTVRSSVDGFGFSGEFVHFTERVRWQDSEGWQQQCSLAVYRVSEGLVRAAWYYPAYACQGSL